MRVIHSNSLSRSFLLPLAAVAAAGLLAGEIFAADTLMRVRSTGVVRCGVSDGLPGFAVKDAQGRWSGMDVDFCRAVAAVVLGDAQKTAFIPLISSARFPELKSKRIDLLVRRTTWTFAREAGLQVFFTGTLHYDGQGFMVPRKGAARTPKELNGATICVVKGTTHEQHLEDYFKAQGLTYRPWVGETRLILQQAYLRGECSALTGDASALAAMRMQLPGEGEDHVILPILISKEPLGVAVNRSDEEWFTIVRWVLFALIEAEERGVTQANVHKLRDTTDAPALAVFLGKTPGPEKALGLSADWVTRIVESVGNYGEIYERNVGRQSQLQLDRGLNRLWKDGGLMYSPPFR